MITRIRVKAHSSINSVLLRTHEVAFGLIQAKKEPIEDRTSYFQSAIRSAVDQSVDHLTESRRLTRVNGVARTLISYSHQRVTTVSSEFVSLRAVR